MYKLIITYIKYTILKITISRNIKISHSMYSIIVIIWLHKNIIVFYLQILLFIKI
jgi:hypothetical protein